MNIIFFDFDGTITTKDTFTEFIKFAKGVRYFYSTAFVIAYFYSLFLLKLISADEAKRSILKFYFKGYSKSSLEELGKFFIEKITLNGTIKPEMMDLIYGYKTQKNKVAVVSASFDIWIGQFCAQHSIDCICTNLAYSAEGIFDGELGSLNCKGVEKANRITDKYNLTHYNEIIVYGDSKGDIEMMNLGTIKNWV